MLMTHVHTNFIHFEATLSGRGQHYLLLLPIVTARDRHHYCMICLKSSVNYMLLLSVVLIVCRMAEIHVLKQCCWKCIKTTGRVCRGHV